MSQRFWIIPPCVWMLWCKVALYASQERQTLPPWQSHFGQQYLETRALALNLDLATPPSAFTRVNPAFDRQLPMLSSHPCWTCSVWTKSLDSWVRLSFLSLTYQLFVSALLEPLLRFSVFYWDSTKNLPPPPPREFSWIRRIFQRVSRVFSGF